MYWFDGSSKMQFTPEPEPNGSPAICSSVPLVGSIVHPVIWLIGFTIPVVGPALTTKRYVPLLSTTSEIGLDAVESLFTVPFVSACSEPLVPAVKGRIAPEQFGGICPEPVGQFCPESRM